MKKYQNNFKDGKKIICISAILALLIICTIYVFKQIGITSFAADIGYGEVQVKASLEKYINYALSEEDNGTLLEYDIQMGITYPEGEEYNPIKDSSITAELSQIDGKYPRYLKVIPKSTEVTNGKTSDIQADYDYDANTGKLTIRASNINENGDIISQTQPTSENKDIYTIIAYYDTYTDANPERELTIKIGAEVNIAKEQSEPIRAQKTYNGNVSENIGKLTSVKTTTDDIYNGYLKANVINGTNYTTQYKEINEIRVSKKEAQDKIYLNQKNTFVKVRENQNGETSEIDLGNGQNLLIKETKISKQEMIALLGETYLVQIFDGNNQLLATIDANTPVDEQGMVTINYETPVEGIQVKTGNVINEGFLRIENTKEITDKVTDIEQLHIKTTDEITGIKEKHIQTETEEKIEEQQVFTNIEEEIVEIKDARTVVNMEMNTANWKNKQQNEITFDVYLDNRSIDKNLFKEPTIKIELPSQVEKVIIENSTLMYGNGLELKDTYLETTENGNQSIVAQIGGTQTQYSENAVGTTTSLKISAIVILKKDIATTTENIQVSYTNQYTLSGQVETGNVVQQVEIENYQENTTKTDINQDLVYETSNKIDTGSESNKTTQNVEGLKLEVAPMTGKETIQENDTLYEGEFIKYNIKVTNNAEETINNIKIEGNIPDGLIYGELQADHSNALGEYTYNFDESVRIKEITIGSLAAGESYDVFYEVQVKDLNEGETEKQVQSNISTFVDNAKVLDYTLNNTVKPASAKIFMKSYMDNDKNRWDYELEITGEENKEMELKAYLPVEYELGYIVDMSVGTMMPSDNYEVSEDNIVTFTAKPGTYIIGGIIEGTNIEQNSKNSKKEIVATAQIKVDDIIYNSNENRILYQYDNVSVEVTSPNEGEEVEYGNEVNYEIKITNIGGSNYQDPAYSAIDVKVQDYLPEELEPVSVTYENWEQVMTLINEETKEYRAEDNFNKVEKTEDISGIQTDEEGNRLPNVDLELRIPYKESVSIKVKATAGLVDEPTKIENSVLVSGKYIQSQTSNIVTHTIVPIKPEEPEEPDPGEEKYSISGLAFEDKNEDGERQGNESLLNGINVMLIDEAKSNEVKAKTKIVSGKYIFENVEKGNYIVVFQYDTEKYKITEYQKPGIDKTLNSDAMSDTITLNGEEIEAGLTDSINLTSSQSNIDIGLITKNTDPEDPDPGDPEDPDPGDPEDPDPGDPDNPGNPEEETYSISGLAFEDANEDGKRQENESLLNGITVMLIDEAKSSEVKAKTKTVRGKYVFENIEEGNYIVIFQYDTGKYKVTEYQKPGVDKTLNSDAISDTITFNGQRTEVGLTDSIELTSSKSNIDIGLVRNKVFDLKLDKSISNIKVKTAKGVKEYVYNNVDLAKVEIRSQEINGALIVIEYKIVITNEGEIDATIEKINDYLPSGLEFSSELNKDWTQNGKGEIINTSLAGQKLKAGESKTLTLVATKSMTADGTGQVINAAEIGEAGNTQNVSDRDSTPGNKSAKEDDYGTAEVLISISTGGYMIAFGIILPLFVILGIALFFAAKHGKIRINKLSIFLMIFATIITFQSIAVYAAAPKKADFKWRGRFNDTYFYGRTNPPGDAICIDHGVDAAGFDPDAHTTSYWTYTYYNYSQTSSSGSGVTNDTSKFTLEKGNDSIGFKTLDATNSILGPFVIKATNYTGGYTIEVTGKNGNKINSTACDENGNSKQVTGSATFYLKVATADCENGIQSIKVTAKKSGTQTSGQKIYGYAYYDPGSGYQRVKTNNVLEISDTTSEKPVTTTKSLTWTNIAGILEIIKQDADNPDKKLSGVEVRIQASSIGYDQTFKTDEEGKIKLENLQSGVTYTITEISTPYYGYTVMASGNITIGSGVVKKYELKNEKQTGNLKIEKRDYDNTSLGLEGVTFKIKNSKGEYIIALDDNGGQVKEVVGSIHLGGMETTSSEDEATSFITDENGDITISNILKDTYTVIETDLGDHYGYFLEDEYVFWEATTSGNGLEAIVEVKRQPSTETDEESSSIGTTLLVKNQKQTGNLKIEKRDYDDENVPIVGVTFKIKNSKGEYIIALNDNGEQVKEVTGSIHLGGMETTSSEDEATSFITDENGNVTIYNILKDTYTVIETDIGDNYGYKLEDEYVFWEATTSGNGLEATVEVERQPSTDTDGTSSTNGTPLLVKNQKQTGNLKIYKKDSHNEDFILAGIEFKIKNSNGEYIIALDDNGNQVKEAVGSIHLGGMETTSSEDEATTFITDETGTIEIYNMWIDTYTVIETSVGDNFGYDLDDEFITWETDESNGNGLTATVIVERQKSYDTNADSIGNGKHDDLTVKNKRKFIKVSGFAWEDRIENKDSTKDYLWNEGTEDKRLANVTVRLKKADGTVLDTKQTDSNGEYIFGNYDEDESAIKIEIDDLVGGYVEFEYNGMSYQSIELNLDKDNGNKAEEGQLREDFNAKYAIIKKGGSTDINGNPVYNIRYNTAEHKSEVILGDKLLYGYEGQLYPINGVDEQYIIQALTPQNGNNILCTEYTADDIREQSIEEIQNINLGVEEREMPDLAITEDMEKVEISLNNYTHTYLYEQRPQQGEDPGTANEDRTDGFNVTVKFGSEYMDGSYTREVYSSDIVYNKQPGNEGKLKILVTYKIKLRNESTNLYNNVRGLVNYYDARYENAVVTDENGNTLNARTTGGETSGFKRLEIDANQELAPQKIKTLTITYQLSNDAVNSLLNEQATLDSVSEISSYSTYKDSGYSDIYGAIDLDSAPDNATPDNIDTYEDDTDKSPSLILNVKEGRVISGTVWEDSALEELLELTGYDKERKGDGIYQEVENVIQNAKVELIAVENKEEAENLGADAKPAKLYQKNDTVVDASVNTNEKGEYSFVGVIPSNYVLRYTYGDNSVIYDPSGNKVENVKADNYKSTIYRGGNKDAVDAMTDYWYRGETSNTDAARLSDAKDKIGIKQDGSIIEDIIADRIKEENEITYDTVVGAGSVKDIIAQTRNFDIKLDYDVNLDNISKYGEDLKFVFDNIDFGIIKRPEQSLIINKEIANVKITLANGTVIVDGDPRVETLSGVKLLDDDVYIELDNEIIQGANLRINYEITVDNKDCEIDYNDEDYYIYGKVPEGHANYAIATVKDMFDYLPEDLVLDTTDENWERIEITSDMKGKLLADNVYEVVKNLENVIHLKNPIFENMEPGSPAIDTSMAVTRQLSTTADDLTYENDIEAIKLKGRKTKDSIPGNYDPTTNEPDEVDDDNVELTITGPTGENRQYVLYGCIGIGILIIVGVGIIIIKRKVLKK